MDGCTLDTEGEKEMVIKCIEAAIQRRVSEVTYRFKLISASKSFALCEKTCFSSSTRNRERLSLVLNSMDFDTGCEPRVVCKG